jgi:MFS family permease
VKKTTSLLLNFAHLLDHLFLLIFAASVVTIAKEFNVSRWEDLMPYTAGAFFMFGLGSIPAGRLGDLWGRRKMMVIFFFGMGASALLVATAQSPLQLAMALTVLGAFSAIYHPVGIPMLVQNAVKPGQTIGINGLSGNLGIAFAALLTGYLVQISGWRMAFIAPAVLSILMGILFWFSAEHETTKPSKRKVTLVPLPKHIALRVFIVITLTSTTGSLLFNFTTNGNGEILRDRIGHLISNPAALGAILAGIYALASVTQLVVGKLIDHVPVKRLFQSIVAMQIVAFSMAALASDWMFVVAAAVYMIAVFGAIPFSDALITRFVDDSQRSRVSGMRLAVSFGISSLAVLLLGPFVKSAGFTVLLVTMAVIAAATFITLFWLPSSDQLAANHQNENQLQNAPSA